VPSRCFITTPPTEESPQEPSWLQLLVGSFLDILMLICYNSGIMASGLDVSVHNKSLLLDGQSLSIESHAPRDLAYVLGSLGREAITAAIEEFYLDTVAADPDAIVSRPSIFALSLGAGALSAFGQRNRTHLHRSIIEVASPVRDYWNTIQSFDFAPEVQSEMGSRKKPQNWLLLRNPETDPPLTTPLEHLPRALGFIEPAVTQELRPKLASAWDSGSTALYLSLRNEYAGACQDAIDRQVDSYPSDDPAVLRANAQIGYMVASANLRVEAEGDPFLLDPKGYENSLLYAVEYAHQLRADDIAETLEMEVIRVQMLRGNE